MHPYTLHSTPLFMSLNDSFFDNVMDITHDERMKFSTMAKQCCSSLFIFNADINKVSKSVLWSKNVFLNIADIILMVSNLDQ